MDLTEEQKTAEAAHKATLAGHFKNHSTALAVEKSRSERGKNPVARFVKNLFAKEETLGAQIAELSAKLQAERASAAALLENHAALRLAVESGRERVEKIVGNLASLQRRRAVADDDLKRYIAKSSDVGMLVQLGDKFGGLDIAVSRAQDVLKTFEAELLTSEKALASFEKRHADLLALDNT